MALKLSRDKVKAFLTEVARSTSLVAPVERDGVTLFRPVRSGEEVVLDYVNGSSGPKDFFFPQTEKMFKFRQGPGTLEILEYQPTEDRVIFGARPCDIAALPLLDKVFGGGPFEDSYYLLRREHTTLIGLACASPAQTCFCTAFGITPGTADGADVMFYGTGSDFLVTVLTEKGQDLIGKTKSFFSDAADADLEELAKEYQAKEAPLAARVNLDGIRDLMTFENPVWDEINAKCLSCGICTYTCPTCHCFLTQDTGRYEEGVRLRCWDSCMFSDYTKMAGGHNPRPTKKERTRQRFMHKLQYYPTRYDGQFLCVGCGRCVEKCPTGLHIASVVQAVREVPVNA